MPTPSTSLSTAIVGTVTVSGTVTADQGAASANPWPISGTVDVNTVAGNVGVIQLTSPWVTQGTATVSGTVDVGTVAGTVTVDGSGVTQPISADALPLPDGAATEATLDRIDRAAQDIGLTAILEREKLAS